ncbi:MAG: tetratricopeptide repeat protein, partial [Minisyncoccia bacterium]
MEQRNRAAAELLRLCAFLAPDAIPEELLTKGAHELGNALAPVVNDAYLLDQAFADLRAYSLLVRDPRSRTLTVHRLVQAVVRNSMPTELQQQWMQRIVSAVDAAFPGGKFEEWPACERLLPHALICATWMEGEDKPMTAAARLLTQTGVYLRERGYYTEAEPLLRRSLALQEQQLGEAHPDATNTLNNLAALYYQQGKFGQAEELYQRSLDLHEQHMGRDHPATATSLSNLALLYWRQGK